MRALEEWSPSCQESILEGVQVRPVGQYVSDAKLQFFVPCKGASEGGLLGGIGGRVEARSGVAA